jgi:hypothetical protein
LVARGLERELEENLSALCPPSFDFWALRSARKDGEVDRLRLQYRTLFAELAPSYAGFRCQARPRVSAR